MNQFRILIILSLDVSGEGTKDGGEGGQHVLVCLLQELGCLMESLSTTSSTIILDTHLSKCISHSSEFGCVFSECMVWASNRRGFCYILTGLVIPDFKWSI